MNVFEKIKSALDDRGVEYTTAHHEPTYTSEQASQIRGVSMHSGAKALVLMGKKSKKHYLCVMPADLRLNDKKIEAIVGEKVCFASDVEETTGCVKGSVPPFGSIIGLPTYCDVKLAENDIINFNAGSLTDSVAMRYTDYIAIENPTLVDLTQ